MKTSSAWLSATLLLLATAPGARGAGDVEVTPEDRAAAKKIYETRCAPCHGAKGQGDGVVAAALSPRPRDLSSPEWQASVKDSYIDKIIQEGGSAVGKSALMPGNPDLKDKPGVVVALREFLRSLGPKSD